MKKVIPMLLVLCLLLIPITVNAFADDHEPLSATVAEIPPLAPTPVTAGEPASAQTRTDPVPFEPGSVPAAAAPMDAISLPIHALVLSMAEQELVYDAQSDLFVWNALYYTLSLYGDMDDRVERTNGTLLLPSEAVQDYLSALTSDRRELPDIPQTLSDRIRYDAASDHYLLTPGHFKPNDIRLEGSAYSDDGSCTLSGRLLVPESDAPLRSFAVTLAPNDGMFGFSILDLTIL